MPAAGNAKSQYPLYPMSLSARIDTSLMHRPTHGRRRYDLPHDRHNGHDASDCVAVCVSWKEQ
jgi:hypothetical protein